MPRYRKDAACAIIATLVLSALLYFAVAPVHLPRFLEHIQPRSAVPDRGIWLTGGTVIGLVLLGNLKAVVSTAAFTILLYYSITNLAALRLPRERRLYANWIPTLGLATCLTMASALSPEIIGGGLFLLVLGFILRIGIRKFNAGQARSGS